MIRAALLLALALVAYLVRPRRHPVPARWDEPSDGLPPFDPRMWTVAGYAWRYDPVTGSYVLEQASEGRILAGGAG